MSHAYEALALYKSGVPLSKIATRFGLTEEEVGIGVRWVLGQKA